jgi:hypothetical protein
MEYQPPSPALEVTVHKSRKGDKFKINSVQCTGVVKKMPKPEMIVADRLKYNRGSSFLPAKEPSTPWDNSSKWYASNQDPNIPGTP